MFPDDRVTCHLLLVREVLTPAMETAVLLSRGLTTWIAEHLRLLLKLQGSLILRWRFLIPVEGKMLEVASVEALSSEDSLRLSRVS